MSLARLHHELSFLASLQFAKYEGRTNLIGKTSGRVWESRITRYGTGGGHHMVRRLVWWIVAQILAHAILSFCPTQELLLTRSMVSNIMSSYTRRYKAYFLRV
jgi:hypothetical protein